MHRNRIAHPARLLLPAIVLCLLGVRIVGAQDREAARETPRPTTVAADGREHAVGTTVGTVADALAAAGIQLGPEDECSPPPTEALQPGVTITVRRVVNGVVVQTEPIRAGTRVLPTRRLRSGMTMIQQHPEDGLKELIYEVKVRDGQVIWRKLLDARVLKPAKEKEILVGGSQRRLPSRGYFSGRRLLVMRASGYDPGPRSCGPRANGRTYLGMKARRGIVAVDPRVIPLGARLFVEGYGHAVAGDIGSAIKGDRIDLCFPTYREAARYGLKKVQVWILSE